jgi:ABC-type uncharacterized transport system permease subunit
MDLLYQVLDSMLRIASPLILAALAGLYSERSGVFDIGLEGKMLIGAFAAGCAAAVLGSAWLGLLAAVIVSMLFGLIHGFASITQRGNQIVSGVALNFLASGLTAFLGEAWFHDGGRTPQLTGAERFGAIHLPFEEAARNIPILGRLYADVLSGHAALVYVAFLCVPLTAWVVYRTRFGLRLRAVGENPAAVDTAGISVVSLRYRALLITGGLCGIAGAILALVPPSAGFGRDMTAGQGYIALAALIFANWRPWRVLGACLLFALLNSAAIRMQGAVLPTDGLFAAVIWAIPYLLIAIVVAVYVYAANRLVLRHRRSVAVPGILALLLAAALAVLELWQLDLRGAVIPTQFITALPYILTVILLAGFIGKSTPPRAGGVPYVKER